MRRMLTACAAAAAIWSPAAAQVPGDEPLFRDATDTHLPARASVPHHSMDVEAADLDGDGDLDLVVPQEWRPNKILLNDGHGRFTDASDRIPIPAAELTSPPLPPQGHDSEDVSVADFDGDRVLDLIIVSEDDIKGGRREVHEYWRGVGGGRFERVPGQLPDTEANAVAHADVTGDGRPDVLIAGFGQDRLLVNDGRGGFRDETGQRLPREAALAQDAEFADLDGDGDLDLVLGLEGGHAIWINDGRGRFADDTVARLPAAGNIEARKVAPVDVDRDGDLDLFFSHVAWQGRAGQDRLYLNDGRGRFTEAPAGHVPQENDTTGDARFADLDGDGDLDMVQVIRGDLRLLANDGAGRFSDATTRWLPARMAIPAMTVEIADLNGDGALDLYVGTLVGGQQADPNGYDRLLFGTRPVSR